MEPKMKFQQGYLIIVAIILIVVVGIIGGLLAYMFIGETKSNIGAQQSKAAFYIASSGLEIAKRDFVANGVDCNIIPTMAKYQNACFPPDAGGASGISCQGYFNVATVKSQGNSFLSAAINSGANYIPLQNSSSYLSAGVVVIDSEIIQYGTKDAGGLGNALRGSFGTVAAAHNASTSVTQDSCTITSTGSVPTQHGQTPAPQGERTVQQILFRGGYGYLVKPLPDGVLPAILVGGNIDIDGAGTIINSSLNGKGCATASVGVVTGKLKKSECANNYEDPDMFWTNPNLLGGSSLYSYIFPQSTTTMISNGGQAAYSTNSAAFNDNVNSVVNSGNDIVWVQGPVTLQNIDLLTSANRVITIIIIGDLVLDTKVTIGSVTAPVKILVTGNFAQGSGNGEVNGLIYVQGNYSVTQTGSFLINGALVVEGDAQLKNSTINLDGSVLNQMAAAQQGSLSVSTPEVYN